MPPIPAPMIAILGEVMPFAAPWIEGPLSFAVLGAALVGNAVMTFPYMASYPGSIRSQCERLCGKGRTRPGTGLRRRRAAATNATTAQRAVAQSVIGVRLAAVNAVQPLSLYFDATDAMRGHSSIWMRATSL